MQKIYETSARKGFYVEIYGIYKPKEINRVLRNCISFFKLKKQLTSITLVNKIKKLQLNYNIKTRNKPSIQMAY